MWTANVLSANAKADKAKAPPSTQQSPWAVQFDKMGELTKRGEHRKSWKDRWFALCQKDRMLYYFTTIGNLDLFRRDPSTKGRTVQGEILLNSSTLFIADYMHAKRKCCFELSTANRHFFIIAKDPADLKSWIIALCSAGVRFKSPVQIHPLVGTMDVPTLFGKHGYLYKRGQLNTGWKRRYFRTLSSPQGYLLAYYDVADDAKPNGSIPLDGSVIIQNNVNSDSSDGELQFSIRTKHRLFAIKAESIGDKNDWIGVLKRLCQMTEDEKKIQRKDTIDYEMPDKDEFYTRLLGVDKAASSEDIIKAYCELARTMHPENNNASDAEVKFAELTQAYFILLNRKSRGSHSLLPNEAAPRGPSLSVARRSSVGSRRHSSARRDSVESRQQRAGSKTASDAAPSLPSSGVSYAAVAASGTNGSAGKPAIGVASPPVKPQNVAAGAAVPPLQRASSTSAMDTSADSKAAAAAKVVRSQSSERSAEEPNPASGSGGSQSLRERRREMSKGWKAMDFQAVMKEQLGGKTLPAGPGQVFHRVNTAPAGAIAASLAAESTRSKSDEAPAATTEPRKVNVDALAALVQKTNIPLAKPAGAAAAGGAKAKSGGGVNKVTFAELFSQARAAGVPRTSTSSNSAGSSSADSAEDVPVTDDDDVVIHRTVDADGNEIKSNYDHDGLADDDEDEEDRGRDPQAPSSLPGLSVISEENDDTLSLGSVDSNVSAGSMDSVDEDDEDREESSLLLVNIEDERIDVTVSPAELSKLPESKAYDNLALMKKRGVRYKQWRFRIVALSHKRRLLLYFQSHEDFQRYVQLNDSRFACRSMTTLHLTMCVLPDPEDESKQCVELSSIGESWLLQPLNVKELKEWVSALGAAGARLQTPYKVQPVLGELMVQRHFGNCGFLMKQDRNETLTFKRRFCRTMKTAELGSYLAVYGDAGDLDPKSVIFLQPTTKVKDAPRPANRKNSNTDDSLSFVVEAGQKSHMFRASSLASRKEWMHVLTRLCLGSPQFL